MRDFQGFPSLQEVECSGRTLSRMVDTLSMSLFRVSDKSPLVTVKTYKNTCHTFTDYASCHIDTGDPRNSVARVLISDIHVGQTALFGCKLVVIYGGEHSQVYNWSIPVSHKSNSSFCKYIIVLYLIFVFLFLQGKSE